MDVDREKYDEQQMDKLAANESEWEARRDWAETCLHAGERRTVEGRHGSLIRVVRCKKDRLYANANDCDNCDKWEERHG